MSCLLCTAVNSPCRMTCSSIPFGMCPPGSVMSFAITLIFSRADASIRPFSTILHLLWCENKFLHRSNGMEASFHSCWHGSGWSCWCTLQGQPSRGPSARAHLLGQTGLEIVHGNTKRMYEHSMPYLFLPHPLACRHKSRMPSTRSPQCVS